MKSPLHPLPLPQEMADLRATHATELAACRTDCDFSVQQLRQQHRREMQQASEHSISTGTRDQLWSMLPLGAPVNCGIYVVTHNMCV